MVILRQKFDQVYQMAQTEDTATNEYLIIDILALNVLKTSDNSR